MAAIKADFPAKLGFLFQPYRYKVAHGGRGSGKSWGYARALILLARSKKVRVLCTREVQKSIKDSVHKLLKDQIEALGLGQHFQVLDTEIRGTNGSEFMFAGMSSQTTESLKSYEGVDIVWVEEAQGVSKDSWNILIPTIRKDGSEIWVSYNPDMDTDETHVRFVISPPPDAFVVEMNYMDNPWFPEVLEKERLHCLESNKTDYDNIWLGKCKKAATGAIYAHEIEVGDREGQFRTVPHDPSLPVHCIWDLGWNDCMAIIMVQKIASELRIIDYIEESFKTLDWYVAETGKRGYIIGEDWLPHDGEHKDYKTGKSAKELLEAMNRKVEITPNISIEEGIKMARMVFKRCYFDKTKAARLLECLKRYRRSINKTTKEPGAPLHDEFSHGADDFRYLAVVSDLIGRNAGLTSHPIFNNPALAAGRAPAGRAGY